MGLTQIKGNIGVCKAIADLAVHGVSVWVPVTEACRYDLIGELGGVLKKIEVRHAVQTDGFIRVKLRSIWTNAQGWQSRQRQAGDFDILCIYCPDTDECYYLGDETFENGVEIRLRLSKPQRVQKTTRMASEFRDCTKMFI